MSATIDGIVSDGTVAEAIGRVHKGTATTANATPTNVVSITPPQDGAFFCDAHVIGDNTTTAGEDVGYTLHGMFSMVAGTLAQVSTTIKGVMEHANSVACDADFVVLGNKIGVAVTGEAATIYAWTAKAEINPDY